MISQNKAQICSVMVIKPNRREKKYAQRWLGYKVEQGRMTVLHLLTFQMKQSTTLWSLPPMSSACLLSAEHFSQRISLSEKWEHVETKENSQRRPNNNNLVIKHSQGPLVPQGLQIIFWAISCELSYKCWNPYQVKKLTMMTRLQPWNKLSQFWESASKKWKQADFETEG